MKAADKIIKYIKDDQEKTFGLDEAVCAQLEGTDPIPGRAGALLIIDFLSKDDSLEVHLVQGDTFTRLGLTAHPFAASAHLWNGPDLLKKTKYRSMLASLFHDLIWAHRVEMAAAFGITVEQVLEWGNGVLYSLWISASGKSILGRIEARLAWEVCEFSKGWYHDAKKLIGLHSLLFALLLLAGCGTPPDWRVVELSGTNAILRAMGSIAPPSEVVVADDATTTSESAQTTTADAVDFSLLVWRWGGVNGSKASPVDGVEIGSLKVTSSKLTYKWVSGGCERLGASSKNDANCLACLFCLIDGRWVGGKFDWISTSRTSRSLTNIAEGYHGWDRDAVSKADAYAFVIISDGGRLRSNVTMEGK